jgi:hypothetical protein
VVELDLVVGGEGQTSILVMAELERELGLVVGEDRSRGMGLGEVRVGLARGGERAGRS